MTLAIQDVDGLAMAFGGDVDRLMPKYAEIPEEFRRGHTPWNDLFSTWFFSGAKNLALVPKDGVDERKALRHIRAVMVSFAPKHEHKEAACAFMLSEWFKSAEWDAQRMGETVRMKAGAAGSGHAPASVEPGETASE